MMRRARPGVHVVCYFTGVWNTDQEVVMRDRLAVKQAEVDAQWAKFNRAVAAGLRGAPLTRIDQKLRRLEDERDAIRDDLR